MKKSLLLISCLLFTAFFLNFNTSASNRFYPDVMEKIHIKDFNINNQYFRNLIDSLIPFPGFPLTFSGGSIEGGIYCNMDSDPELEIVYNCAYNIYAFNLDGSNVSGWPRTVSSYPLDGAPALGDIDGDGSEEIVAVNHGVTSGGFINAFEKNGTPVTGFPVNHGYSSRTPVLANLDADPALEIVVNKRTYPTGQVYLYEGNGTVMTGWPKNMGHVPASSPAVGDINGDNSPEIVMESYTGLYVWKSNGDSLPGFPFMMPNGDVNSYSSPVLVDVNADSKREIIFGTHVSGAGGYVYILTYDGTVLPNWPKQSSNWIYGPPAVGFIDGDNILDIAVGDQVMSGTPSDYVYAWNVNGTSLSGFPIGPINAVNTQILLADVDNDNMTELIFDDNTATAGRGKYLCYNHDGTPNSSWLCLTNGTSFFSTPCLFDADRNGILDMSGSGSITTPSQQVSFYLWNVNTPYNASKMYLPMFQYNPRHNGVYGDIVLTSLNNYQSTITENFELFQNYPNPFNSSCNISYRIKESGNYVLKLYDITGKLVRNLFSEYKIPGTYYYRFESGNLGSGVYFYTIAINGKILNTKTMILLK